MFLHHFREEPATYLYHCSRQTHLQLTHNVALNKIYCSMAYKSTIRIISYAELNPLWRNLLSLLLLIILQSGCMHFTPGNWWPLRQDTALGFFTSNSARWAMTRFWHALRGPEWHQNPTWFNLQIHGYVYIPSDTDLVLLAEILHQTTPNNKYSINLSRFIPLFIGFEHVLCILLLGFGSPSNCSQSTLGGLDTGLGGGRNFTTSWCGKNVHLATSKVSSQQDRSHDAVFFLIISIL